MDWPNLTRYAIGHYGARLDAGGLSDAGAQLERQLGLLARRAGKEMPTLTIALRGLRIDPEGNRLSGNLWAQYGLAGVLEHEGFIRDVTTAAGAAGVGIEQFHPEYGINQFEMSLAPTSPVAAADQLILARIVISRVARAYGLRVSLSPVPFAGSVGSGAHQHFSLIVDKPLFSGGAGVHGLTPQGESAIGGIIAGLPQAQLINALGGFDLNSLYVVGDGGFIRWWQPSSSTYLAVTRDPGSSGATLEWGNLAVVAAWGVVGLLLAIRYFRWTPRGG